MVAAVDHTKNSQVVGLGPAAGKDNLGSAAVQQLGHALARTLNRRPRLLPVVMDGRGVPKALTQIGTHGLQRLWQ